MDLCVAQSIGCDSSRNLGLFVLSFVIGGTAIISIAWSYWTAYQERQSTRRQRQMATPVAISQLPTRRLRSQAHQIKSPRERFPLNRIDRILALFFRGGSISGF